MSKWLQPGSIGGAALSLAVATIGAGILALPSAFSDAGVLTSLCVMTIVAVFTVLSIRYLAVASEALQLYSYESIARELLGPSFEAVIRFMLIVYNFGVGVGYVVAMGELLEPFHPWISATFPLLASPKEIMVAFWALVMLPLSFVRHIGALNKLSLLAIIAIHFIAFAVIYRYFDPFPADAALVRSATGSPPALIPTGPGLLPTIHRGPGNHSETLHVVASHHRYARRFERSPRTEGLFATVPTLIGEPLQIHLASWDIVAILSMPIMLFAFDCQALTFQIYHSLWHPSVRSITRVATLSVSMCFGVYGATGIFGYLSHGQYVRDNILNNYDPKDDLLFAAAYGMYVIPVNLAFSLVMFPVRDAIFNYMFHTHGGDDEEEHVSSYHFNLVSLLLSCGCVLVAIVTPGLTAIFSLLGAFCGSTICFVYPALFRIQMHQLGIVKSSGAWGYRAMWSMLWLGLFGATFGTGVSIWKMTQPST